MQNIKMENLRPHLPPAVIQTFDQDWSQQSDQQCVAVIGDVHGCFHELLELVSHLWASYGHDLKIVLTGDMVDRGPSSESVYNFVRKHGILSVRGNHDDKFRRWMLGNPVRLKKGLAKTLQDFGWSHFDHKFVKQIQEEQDSRFADLLDVHKFFEGLPTLLDFGAFQVVHAQPGESEGLHIRGEKRKHHGVEIRYDWWRDWDGKLTIFGHYWHHKPIIAANYGRLSAIGIDTRCVAGGALTAVVLPQLEFRSVVPHETYFEIEPDHNILEKLELEAWESNWQ